MIEKILQTFAEHPAQFISGGELSNKLKCSRTAIWKHIESLRKQGYEFEAIPRRGYRLISAPNVMNVQRILANLKTRFMGRHFIYAGQLESTQIKAHEQVAKGAVEGTVILAEEQTKGKGTRGKQWHSPRGMGIWFSIVLKPRMPAQFISQLTLLTSVALCRTISQTLGINIGVKWPNDLLIDGKKVSGILLESSSEDDRLRYVIAGVGISANFTLDDFPPDLRDKATSLQIAGGQHVDREQLLCDFLMEFEQLYVLYLEQGFAPIRTIWEALSVSLHRPIEVHSSYGFIEGIAQGLDETGALIVKDQDGELKKIFSGDVLHK